jgi:WD40-like Beta Propeller Repeat
MKTTELLVLSASALSALVMGCSSDGGMIDPAPRSGDATATLSSQRYTAWSDPTSLTAINQAGTNDQQPALSKDGLSLYFASTRKTSSTDGVLDLNIWVARRACTDGCAWTEIDVVPGLNDGAPGVNTDFPDVSPTLSRDEHYLFFASQRPHSCYPPQTAQCTDRDLYVSYREDEQNDLGWGPAVNLGDGINTDGEEVAPNYFENADAGVPQLFFNRGALGGDIYVSELHNGVWGPTEEVKELNTAGTDQRPSVSHDGRQIYFYSDRNPGPAPASANRLWVAQRQSVSDDWSAPVPVEFPTSDKQESIMPFIHSHGRTETLLFVRPFSPLVDRDLWITTRTRLGGPE